MCVCVFFWGEVGKHVFLEAAVLMMLPWWTLFGGRKMKVNMVTPGEPSSTLSFMESSKFSTLHDRNHCNKPTSEGEFSKTTNQDLFYLMRLKTEPNKNAWSPNRLHKWSEKTYGG